MDNEFCEVWAVHGWAVAEQQQLDQWGHAPDHNDYELEKQTDYTDTIPYGYEVDIAAVRMGVEWSMSPEAVMDMDMATFHKRAMITRAMNLRKPKWTGELGHLKFMAHKAKTGQRFKPRRH